MGNLGWGIIGTGAIAHAFARGITESSTGLTVAVGSRSKKTANAFADEFSIPNRHASYTSLLADPEVQAVYISTPHPFHAEWAVRAAEAGKHIVCEKPMALNHAQGMAIVAAAREHEVFLMEAFMYRCHPQTSALVEILKRGEIGEIRMIRASLGFGGGNKIDPKGRLFNSDLGGGSILDVGCYPVSMARLIAGVAEGAEFANPVQVLGAGHIGGSHVDEWAAALLRFKSGIVAEVASAVRVSRSSTLEIYGADGRIAVEQPWVTNRVDAEDGKIVVDSGGHERIVNVPADRTSFSYEADRAAKAIERGEMWGAWPATSWQDTLGNLAVLDSWRESIGLVYDAELPIANKPVRGTLKRKDTHRMKYGRIEGLEKSVSRLILGCDNQLNFAHGAVMWDDWFERGGNAFDTSWVYGGGRQEELLGHWVKRRALRAEVVVVVKGAHTPRCNPDDLDADFHESLDRLQFDFADLYLMHRDNPDIPVGEFVDVLNDLKQEGLIRGPFGGSNWSFERFDAANDYAETNGKQGFDVLSNNLSLAHMVRPIWNGCIDVSDTASRSRLQRSQTTNLAWSSQARGYFLPDAQRMKLGSDNFACWDSAANQARRERAAALAAEKRCTVNNIAAAYVLNQQFPSFALVGPRTIEETASTLPALDVGLTNDELSWLWGEEQEDSNR